MTSSGGLPRTNDGGVDMGSGLERLDCVLAAGNTGAGVRVGLGQDGIRDHWWPYGNSDVFERCWQLAFCASQRRDDAIETCVDMAATRRSS